MTASLSPSARADNRPDLYDVLEAFRQRPRNVAFAYRAMLATRGFPGVEEALIRRRLTRLEKLGYVRRTHVGLLRIIAWEEANGVGTRRKLASGPGTVSERAAERVGGAR